MTINTYPLVSILIPTYNRPHYFQLALDSALAQTYPNIEIIIGDDSTDNKTQELIKQSYLPIYKNIVYIQNSVSLGQFQNGLLLFEKASGNYINYLMDDDLLHPDKIQKMMNLFLTDNSLSLVTSYRKLIDEKGEHIPDGPINIKLCEITTKLSGMDVGNQMLMNCCNYIGEPTTPLFKKEHLIEAFGTLNGREYNCCVDMASWIHLLSKGNLTYISEPLSYFRIHSGQQLQSNMKLVEGIEDLTHLITVSKNYGFLQNKTEYQKALQEVLQRILYAFQHYNKDMTDMIYQRLTQCVETVKIELQLLQNQLL
ncbi:TPA: glycosyltransferase [Bacillus toyonensis]|uniref:glycosyltransferase family 2 protein n=1 Tax=Bacillus toyonensis TaxID=155322 RepID=UPI000BED86B6|nr:glycosyltransferase [Bacillus toyonensis]PEB22423.1 glycosyl transferase family 2 [Bacillus toyonensis]PFY79109.1 glycosyl transferase family 2 [Bacillus toyonensis]QWI08800.1 glycosyltransferase [Bacillus toyonensis]HDR7386015.1 glycosyltransferase [Bacillus toyonensis]